MKLLTRAIHTQVRNIKQQAKASKITSAKLTFYYARTLTVNDVLLYYMKYSVFIIHLRSVYHDTIIITPYFSVSVYISQCIQTENYFTNLYINK